MLSLVARPPFYVVWLLGLGDAAVDHDRLVIQTERRDTINYLGDRSRHVICGNEKGDTP